MDKINYDGFIDRRIQECKGLKATTRFLYGDILGRLNVGLPLIDIQNAIKRFRLTERTIKRHLKLLYDNGFLILNDMKMYDLTDERKEEAKIEMSKVVNKNIEDRLRYKENLKRSFDLKE